MPDNSTRLASATTYSNAVTKLTSRQAEMAKLQDQLSASKKILRPSDDPTGAAQAERATTRMARIATDQRALAVQRSSVATAESTLGDASTALQTFRSLVVQAGSSSLSAADRDGLATQMSSLRDQLLSYANGKDTNGQPLFGGLGSTSTPFTETAGGVVFDGIGGQATTTAVAVPSTLDGQATWMDVPTGNGVFAIAQTAGTNALWSDAGQVTDPGAVTGHGYRIEFGVANGATTYSVIDTTNQSTVQSAQPFKSGQAIQFDGISLTASGTPADGNALTISPSTRTSLFGVLDQAIAGVRAGEGGVLAQNVGTALSQLDSGISRISASRGHAGDLLNQVDSITDRQSSRTIQLEADRSRAEDLDMVKALSDFQVQQTAYSAALGSYAQIQKLSLFNFVN